MQASFEAQNFFSWGKIIPEEIFRHFVLPYRVNNENLDSARWVFFGELKDRIKNLSMEQAALEVNHWCHEKVNYQSADERTSSPLATVKTSWGRCGEESTFTVTAMRAVGIPARQVYTPRWAHQDDNHAWVEVWIEGRWYYLGACEPEPKLDMGWFTEPARRAMLVHTKVFGDYNGSEEVVGKSDNHTEINVIGNYADVKTTYVKVIDKNNKPVENASVDFGLYNYAEFYPIASKLTNAEGFTFLTTGLGDLLIWANKNNGHASQKISVALTDTLFLTLENKAAEEFSIDLDIFPPVEKTPFQLDDKLQAANKIRLAAEDSIRGAYKATFISKENSDAFARENNFDVNKVWVLMQDSFGNYAEIQKYLLHNKNINHQLLFALLEKINKKDLRDSRADILTGHLQNALKYFENEKYFSDDIFFEYVLNPRIKNENLLPYRELLQSNFVDYKNFDRAITVNNLVQWINKNIVINETVMYYNLPLTPVGVYELRVANAESRDIFFVAVCRSLGVPSRLEQATKTPQYFNGSKWLNVYFEKPDLAQPDYGQLVFDVKNKSLKLDPMYYIHFTIAKLTDGKYITQDYEWETKLSNFPGKINLVTGNYRLITSNRQQDGSVLTQLTHFNIDKNKITNVPFEIRADKKAPEILGKIDLAETVQNSGGVLTLQSLIKNDYLILGWIEPDKEPTKHIFTDLKSLKENFESWNGNIVFAVPEFLRSAAPAEEILKGLPANCMLVKDNADKLFEQMKSTLGAEQRVSLPYITVSDKNGNVILLIEGYKIGGGEQLIKSVK